MAKWINRVVLTSAGSGSTSETYNPNSGTVNSGTNFSPTAGNLLVIIIGGPITSTTPSGWTLPANGSAINANGLYVMWKVAAGADTFATVHNGDGTYPTIAEFLEFPAGSTVVTSASNNSVASGAAGPTLSGLTGTNLLIGASAYPGNTTSAAVTWNTGVEDTDTAIGASSPKWVEFSTNYLEDSVLTSISMTVTRTSGAAASFERLQFAINVSGSVDPTYPPITLRAAGTSTAVAALTTAINPAVPAGTTATDLSVLSVACKPYTTTIVTPSGWTPIGETTNGTVASGVDVGSMKVAMFARIGATVGAIGNMTLTGAGTAVAVIHSYSKGAAYSWDIAAATSGGDTVNDANFSATGGILPVAVGDWVVSATAVNTDLAVGGPTGQSIGGLTGATYTGAVRTAGTSDGQGLVTTGNDGRLMVVDAAVTAGSSVTPPTFTYTLGSSSSGATMWLRLRQTLPWWSPGKRTQQAIRRAANW